MLRRFTLILLLVIPLAAHADDASMLGPQTEANTGLQQTNVAGDGPAGLSALQPAEAGTSALPDSNGGSATGGDSSGTLQTMDSTNLASSSSAAQSLQQPDASANSKLLVQGEADQPHSLASGSGANWLLYTLIALLVVTGITALIWLMRRRRA